MLNLDKKKIILNNLCHLIEKSNSIIFIDLFKVDANNVSIIRRLCKENFCIAKIFKKTLILKAIQNTKYEKFLTINQIPCSNIMIFSFEHIGFIARNLLNNEKIENKLLANCAITDFKLFNSKNVLLELSKFPTKLEILVNLIQVLKKISIVLFILLLLYIKKK